jgi:hypothetical protein
MKKKGNDLPAEKELAKKIRDAWASFAKDPEHGLEKLGWPVYDPNSKLNAATTRLYFRSDLSTTEATVVVLGGKQDATIKFQQPSEIDVGC